MAFLPGKGASVVIGSTSYNFDEWDGDIKNGLSKTTNFGGGGYSSYISGITDAKITVSGPYDAGNYPPFIVGATYTLILGYSSMLNLTVTCILEGISPTVKVEDAIRVKLSFQQTGSFSAEIS